MEQVRKKNLQPGSEHQVRVRAKTGETWGDFSEPVSWSTLASDAKRIAEAPSVTGARERQGGREREGMQWRAGDGGVRAGGWGEAKRHA